MGEHTAARESSSTFHRFTTNQGSRSDSNINKDLNYVENHRFWNSYSEPIIPQDSRFPSNANRLRQDNRANLSDYNSGWENTEYGRNNDYYFQRERNPHRDHRTRQGCDHNCQRNIKRNFKPPTFSGKYGDWKVFRMLFEQASDVNNWDEREQLFNLINNLEGEAKAFVSALDEEARSMSLRQLMARLEHRFGGGRNPEHYRTMLINKYWNHNEDPRQYADEIRRLVSFSHPTCPVNYKEELIKHHFITGIHDTELRCQLGLHEFHSLDDVVRFVERWVDTQVSIKKVKSHTVRMVAPYPDSDDESDTEYDSDYEHIKYVSKYKPPGQHSFGKRGYEKFNNHKNSYMDRKTYNYKRFSAEKSFEPSQRKTFGEKPVSPKYSDKPRSEERDWNTIKCYQCGGIGHLKSECPSLNRINLNYERPTLGEEKA